LDSGYIYEAGRGDLGSSPRRFEAPYRSSRGSDKTPDINWVEPVIAVNRPGVNLGTYNELIIRKVTFKGLFYADNVKEEVIEDLKALADEFSFREYINPAWINRRKATGVPKMIKKVYPIYKLNVDKHTWKEVYRPKEHSKAKHSKAA
jgi:hypothetical protein